MDNQEEGECPEVRAGHSRGNNTLQTHRKQPAQYGSIFAISGEAANHFSSQNRILLIVGWRNGWFEKY